MGFAVSRLSSALSGLLIAALFSAVFSGCGSNNVARVEGTVRYEGKPLEQGRVSFYPPKGRPAFGDIQQGRFVLTTFTPGDGALAGNHRVTIHCDKPTDPNDAFSDRVPMIPERYFHPDTSGITAEVKVGERNQFDFELSDDQR